MKYFIFMQSPDEMVEFYWDALKHGPMEFSNFHEAEHQAAELRQAWRGVKYGVLKVKQPLRKSRSK
jgi:hypothetical protein